MQSRNMLLAGMAALSFTLAGCEKPAGDAAVDTAAAPSAAATDRSADERAIIALDSGWVRQILAKNIDSLMSYYAPDVVSYGFTGGGAATGVEQLRPAYVEMMKATITNPAMTPGPVKFSDDGTMAFDHGTYSMTVTPPGGKPTKESAAYLNVWRKIDGQWKLVAEMSTPFAAASR